MTLAEIKAMNKDVLLPSEAAGPLGCDPHYIRVAEEAGATWVPCNTDWEPGKDPSPCFHPVHGGDLGK